VQKVKEAEVLQHHLLPKTAGRELSKVRIAVEAERSGAYIGPLAPSRCRGTPRRTTERRWRELNSLLSSATSDVELSAAAVLLLNLRS
jgi:hypothetical protein